MDAASGRQIRYAMAVLAGALVLLLAGYAIGRSGGADLAAARQQGAKAGLKAGSRTGGEEGYRAGYQKGYRSSFKAAYERAGAGAPD